MRSEQKEELYFMDKRYKVERILGRGSMAQTYLASYADYADAGLGLCVLKQFHRPDEIFDQAFEEYNALRKFKSKYLPSVMDIFRRQDDVHIKMEYIPGPTLQDIEKDFPWPLDRWWTFTQDLLNAVEELEKKQLFHRDIKPANIILHEDDNHPVLIDFGFAVKQSDTSNVRFAGTPLFLPPEALSASQLPTTVDRYAVSVVLFKVLTGYLPFELQSDQQRKLRVPPEITDEKVCRIAKVLLRVVSNNPIERPESAAQMRQELQNALLAITEPVVEQQLSPQINFWVEHVRGLYRNSNTGNADNRGLDTQFVRNTYVPTALDEILLPMIFEHQPNVVFLTGNPGDGKTAFLEQVQQELIARKAQRQGEPDASGWEWDNAGHIFRSCYDASEAHAGQSADEQLIQKLQGLEGKQTPEVPLTVLVAINDGRLVDFFERYKERFPLLAKQVVQSRSTMAWESSSVWVVDLKRRSFVNFPHAEAESIFVQVLQRLVAPRQWTICNDCVAKTICPILNNAVSLRKKRVQQRLEHLLLLTHLRRQRHMTMRDLRSALAYLITGNASCEHIHFARDDEEAGASLVNLTYWRSAFASLEMHDELLNDIASLDPGRFPHPHLDRYLHFHQSLSDAETRRTLFADGVDLPAQRFKDEVEWIAAIKRRLYFEAKSAKALEAAAQTLPKTRALSLLPYRYARDFIDLLGNNFDDEGVSILREEIALGILRSDGIIEDVPENTLSIQVRSSEDQQLIVLKQFPLEDFKLYPEWFSDTDIIERLPEIVILEHKKGFPRLEITLDLFELLMRMASGLLPNAEEFQPLLEDLKLFKDALILGETRDLILIENYYRVHHITQDAGKIVRTAM
jgi:serine/threonine protein kinase